MLPRYATARNPQLATYGPQVDAVAAALGHPSMPWQSLVNAVANEVLDDGRFRYPTVILSTPRQAGKTTLLAAILAHRAMTMPDFRAYYTAQTGLHARDVWTEWANVLERRMPKRWMFRRSAGMETATWPATGGFIRAFPPTPDSLHSKQSDFVGLDEVWSYTEADGKAITQAAVPTQSTRPRGQIWIVSTAGTEDSIWMRSWILRGRDSVNDPDADMAYFEWSAPEDAPWDDPDTWAAYHPAYGYTQDERSLRIAIPQVGGEEGFRRGYLNQWPATKVSWRSSWPTLASPDTIPADAKPWISADSQSNHRTASIVAAAPLQDGRVAVEVIDNRPGIEWVTDALVQIVRRNRARVIIDRAGPLGFKIDELKRAGIPVIEAGGNDRADACARFQALTTAGLIAHRDDPRLNIAVENATTRDTGDRSTWRRKDASVDISPLVAASFAAWRAALPPVKPKT